MNVELDGNEVAEAPDPSTSGAQASNRRYFRNLIFGALGLMLVCGAIVALSSGGDDATEVSTDGFDDVATTVPDPDQLCMEELSAWMPWVTGPGSTMDAAAEWGMNSEEYKIIVTSWSTFNRQLYAVGNDQASAVAYEDIVRGCRAMTYDYVPGHQPPG